MSAVSRGADPAGTDKAARGTNDPTTIATLIRHRPRELALALLLGVVAAGCAVGLAATSGWLISK
ncbi:MAG: hypothetical protein HOW97_30300, partial [Catenulispora sp.]|nr:hypothetical protein [Catenulispora sp.]